MRKLILVLVIVCLASVSWGQEAKPYAIICAIYKTAEPVYRIVILKEDSGIYESPLLSYIDLALLTIEFMQKYTLVYADEMFRVLKEANYGR